MSSSGSVVPESFDAADLEDFEWFSPPAKRHRLIRWLEGGEMGISIALILMILVFLIMQVVSRRFFEPVPWTDEAVRYSNIVLGYAAAALAMAANTHIRVDLLDRFWSKRGLQYLKAVMSLIIAATCAVVVIVSIPYVQSQGARMSVALHLPMAVLFGTVVVLLAVQAIHAVIWIFEDLRHDDPERVVESS